MSNRGHCSGWMSAVLERGPLPGGGGHVDPTLSVQGLEKREEKRRDNRGNNPGALLALRGALSPARLRLPAAIPPACGRTRHPCHAAHRRRQPRCWPGAAAGQRVGPSRKHFARKRLTCNGLQSAARVGLPAREGSGACERRVGRQRPGRGARTQGWGARVVLAAVPCRAGGPTLASDQCRLWGGRGAAPGGIGGEPSAPTDLHCLELLAVANSAAGCGCCAVLVLQAPVGA